MLEEEMFISAQILSLVAPLGLDSQQFTPRNKTLHIFFFCKGSDTKQFRLCRSCGLCRSHSFLPLWNESSHRPCANERVGWDPMNLHLQGRVVGQIWLKGPGSPTLLRIIDPPLSVHESAKCLDVCFGKPGHQNYRTNDFHSHLHLFMFFHEVKLQSPVYSWR